MSTNAQSSSATPKAPSFTSRDIKKKHLSFNVEPKNSDKLAAKFINFRQKVSAHPLWKGHRKYITMSVAVFIVVAAITLPVLIPSLLHRRYEPEPVTSYEEQRQINKDTASTVNNIDPDASGEVKDAIIADLDAKIASASTPSDRAFLIQTKALALEKYGRLEEAIDIQLPLVDEFRSGKKWDKLVDVTVAIATDYAALGNKVSAIEWADALLRIYAEEAPATLSRRAYYTDWAATLKASLAQ